MKGKIISTDKYTEHWSFDGRSYVEVPKWVTKQVRREAYTRVAAYTLIALLLFTASAYIATAQTAVTRVSVLIPCSMQNMVLSKCVPEGYWELSVLVCEV